MTKIYIADISCLSDEKIFNDIYRKVSCYRKAKVDRLRLPQGKRLSLGAGFLLKKACFDFGVPYGDMKIIFNEHGKPSFTNDIMLNFNLSHSGTKVMCVMSKYEVGCDVEQIRAVKMKIAKRYFSDAEYAFIMSFSNDAERANAFYRVWTLKESYVKCTGYGLSLSLKDFSLIFDGDDVLLQSDGDDVYSFFEYEYDDGYRYACCLKNMDKRFVPQVVRCNILDL